MKLTFSALLAFLLLSACTSSAPLNKPNDREWSALTAQYDSMDAIRKASPSYADRPTRREQIEVLLETYRKIDPLYGPFMERLREYGERTGDERALHLYAMEKIRMGDEYMNVLARFDNAVTLYQSALTVEPGNTVAQQHMADAQSRRFVSMDRFAQVREGMTEEQVRKLLGQPREDWIKQVVQRNRAYSVWIFPKPDGGASAVYFDGGVVYHTNWNAAPSKGESR